MIRLIIYVMGIAAAVAGAVWMANEPGTVNLTWRGWHVHTSVGVLVAAMITVVVIILFLLRMVSALNRTVKAFATAKRERRMQRGLVVLGDGFAAVQAGQQASANRLTKDSYKLLGDSSAVLVLKLVSAKLGNDSVEIQTAAKALLGRPQTELAALRTLANRAQADGDNVGALRHAEKALASKDAPDWALKMALDIRISMGLWTDAIAVLGTKLGKTIFEDETYQRLKLKLYVQEANSALKRGDASAAISSAKKAMATSELNPEAVAAYAKVMTSQGKGKKAANIVEKAWQSNPHPALLSAYQSLVPGESALDWAKRIESLAKTAPDHPETRLAVANASLGAELWGQVRNKLSALTNEDTTPDIRASAALLMADVEVRERADVEAANEWLQLAIATQQRATVGPAPPKSTSDLLTSF